MKDSGKQAFLENDTLLLRSLSKSDVNGNYKHWLNDPETVKFNSHGRFPMAESGLLAYVEVAENSRSVIVLAVVDKESGIHIGNISLQAINWVDRNAEIAFLLGERAFWGKGIMHQAGALLIEHAFKTLNLHRIYCGTSSSNKGMQKLAIKLGMNQEGVRCDAIFNGGEYHDIIEYGLLNNT